MVLAAIFFTVTHPVFTVCWSLAKVATDVYFTSTEQPDDSATMEVVSRRLTDPASYAGGEWLFMAVVSLVFSIIIPMFTWPIYAYLFKSGVTDKRAPFQANSAYLSRLDPGQICACFSDIHLCLNGCCCYEALAGDTLQTAGVQSYWFIIFAFYIEWCVATILGFIFDYLFVASSIHVSNNDFGIGFAWLIVGGAMAFWLAKMRTEYRIKFGGSPNFQMDCICYWCCSICSIAADADALGKSQNASVECCCKLNQKSAPQVGQPVTVVGQVVDTAA
jgi:Cys-rich protein (TIGR01571 family)